MAHEAGAYPGFRSMKRLGVFLLPPGGMLVHRTVTPSSKFTGTHLYTWVERGTMGVKCLVQEHNVVPRPGLEPGPLDPESCALTTRPPRLPQNHLVQHNKQYHMKVPLSSFCLKGHTLHCRVLTIYLKVRTTCVAL